MTKEIYMNRRKALVDEAQACIDKNDMKGYAEKEKELKKLDEDFEAQATAQANLNALNGNIPSAAAEFYASNAEALNDFDSMEYRKAFMNYVTKNEPIPDAFSTVFRNSDEVTKTTDVSPVIPTTVLNRIIEKMENIGTVLNLVTKTSYRGGLTIPTSTVKPTATWVSEGAGSDKQKSGVDGSITFTYHKLRCAVSMTLEVSVMSLSAFETKFVNDVAYAMTKALEQAIINGSGTDRPKGILTETPPEGQAIEIENGKNLTFATLIDMESALPSAYENGASYFMTKKTFMTLYGMVDEAGQPIARVNYGIGDKPERSLLGRSVVILDDYIGSFTSTVSQDTIVAFIFNPADYVLNTNYEITAKVYEDNDTDDIVRKAVMLTDGKVIDKNSLVTLTIKKTE